MRKTIFLFLLIGFISIPFFYNCSPSTFQVEKNLQGVGEISLALACGDRASGTRWWDLDTQTQSYSCPSGNTIQVRYYIEKRCDNGIILPTGQRVLDSTGPTCAGVCQSQTQAWTVSEGHLQQTISCSNGQAFNNIYERLVEYRCENNSAVSTGNVQTGALVSGQSCSIPGAPCGNDVSGTPRAEGSVWQERISDATNTSACPNGGAGTISVNCEQYLEFQCTSGLKQLTTRQIVTMNCLPTSTCSTAPASCSTESGPRQDQESWTSRIYPNFEDPGVCALGGDLMISSARLQTYTCNNGAVVAQQVVRGQNMSQVGQCAPKACVITNGTGQQNWMADTSSPGAGGQWGVCYATSCSSGYEIYNGQCVVPCEPGQSRNPSGICQVQICINPGDSRTCYLSGGAAGTQTCDSTRTQWSTCQ